MMGTRAVAIVVAVLVPGYWRIIPVIAGTLLPYIAVVMANAVHSRDLAQAETGYVAPTRTELAGTPFEGIVVPDDASELDED